MSTPNWYPQLAPPIGTPNWHPQFCAPNWHSQLAPPIGIPNWYPQLATPIGNPNWQPQLCLQLHPQVHPQLHPNYHKDPPITPQPSPNHHPITTQSPPNHTPITPRSPLTDLFMTPPMYPTPFPQASLGTPSAVTLRPRATTGLCSYGVRATSAGVARTLPRVSRSPSNAPHRKRSSDDSAGHPTVSF